MDDLASFFYKRADELKKARKFEEALKIMDEANKIKNEEKSPDFWYKRGIRFCEFGEYEKALDCFDKDLRLRQKSYETFFEKGKVLVQLKKYAESVECFNKAAEEHHQQYLQCSKKAEHMKKAHKYEKALIYSDLASHETPLDHTFWHYKAMALLRLQKYDAANSCFMHALEIKNDDPKVLYDLAKCELLAGNTQKSLEILGKSCSLDPFNKEKLRVDNEFSSLSEDKQFRTLVGL
ncbi:tetratricopeptide repeat protein [Candidatus Parcubacteria bacterium]|nr:MAG: tetratricopeptide repeat protein [Candidatus Parcubacteria bacterium]